MINQWLSWLNALLVSLAILLGVAATGFWLSRPSEINTPSPAAKKGGLPKSAFELPQENYNQLGQGILSLQQAAPSMQLPDLRQQLIYYGKNGRPDAHTNYTLLHFSLNGGNKAVISVRPENPLYLVYDRKISRYVFSPNNEKSSLWIEATPGENNEVQIKVTLENDKGEKVTEPESHAQFNLPEKEFIRYAGATWELGSYRVDGTLLARQKARWFGPDRFLEQHGGKEYQDMAARQRIDFGENDDIYSVFVKATDTLIWNQKENRWQVVSPGEESLGHPLLVVKKIEDRLMTFELWDVEGKGKILLNLLKSTEPWAMQNAQSLQPMFKFVGARTRTQNVFEVNKERMVLSPSDWLLLTPKGWKKLATEEEIDNYVRRKVAGTLFVFEGIVRKDEKQVMKGTLYSPSRNDFQSVELALQVGGNNKTTAAKDVAKDNAKETKELAELNKADKQAPLTRSPAEMIQQQIQQQAQAPNMMYNNYNNAVVTPPPAVTPPKD